MSCIAVEIKDNQIKFAWDTREVFEDMPLYQPVKVQKFGKFYVGFTGKIGNREKVYESFSNRILSSLDEVGFDSEEFDTYDSVLISDGRQVRKYKPHFGDVYQVVDFDAIGSGSYYASGAHRAGADLKKSVEIACELNIQCGTPVRSLVIGENG